MKPTPAMKAHLRKLVSPPMGYRPRPNYDVAGRMRDMGLIEIIDEPGTMGWPWSGWSMKITDAGREAAKK